MGRPLETLNFKPTKAMREEVEWLVHDGMTISMIAAVLGVSSQTVQRHFRDQIDNGRARVKARLTAMLCKAAKAGNVAAQKYLDSRDISRVPKPEPLGKKETLQRAAQSGHEGTEWGDLLN